MNRHDTSKSGLFLIELILSIFFFIIAMAVCLQLFVKAHTLSQDTIAMNHAILWTQNLAELFLGNDGDFSCVKQAYRDSDCVDSFAFDADTCLLLAFDKKWNATNNTADLITTSLRSLLMMIILPTKIFMLLWEFPNTVLHQKLLPLIP